MSDQTNSKGVDRNRNQKGQVLVISAFIMTSLLAIGGLVIDFGRAYLIKQQLGKGLDAAVLAAGRVVGLSEDRAEQGESVQMIREVFKVNFPNQFLMSESVNDLAARIKPEFSLRPSSRDATSIDITARLKTKTPTYFTRLLGLETLEIAAISTANRKFADVCFAVDTSGSLRGVFEGPGGVKEQAKDFINHFNPNVDRIALANFSMVGSLDANFNAARGFDPDTIKGAIDQMRSTANTATGEGLRRCYLEFQRVINSPGLNPARDARFWVVFSDGAPNSFGAHFTIAPDCIPNPPSGNTDGILATGDLSNYSAVLGLQARRNGCFNTDPHGLYDINLVTTRGENGGVPLGAPFFGFGCCLRDRLVPGSDGFLLPRTDRRESNPEVEEILYDPGAPADLPGRGLINRTIWNRRTPFANDPNPPDNPLNLRRRLWCDINSVGRNLAERWAFRAREERPPYLGVQLEPVTIFSLGFGPLLGYRNGRDTLDGCADLDPPFGDGLGRKEMGRFVLARIANVPRITYTDAVRGRFQDDPNTNFNPNQPEGLYTEAPTLQELQASFNEIANAILIRLAR